MANYHIPRETIERLNLLNSNYVFAWTGPPRCKRGEECRCAIVDRATGKAYAVAVAANELNALHAALDIADGATRPLTAGEQTTELRMIRAERDELKRQIANLKQGQGAPAVPPPAPAPSVGSIPQHSDDAPVPGPAQDSTGELPQLKDGETTQVPPPPAPAPPPPTAAETEAAQAAAANAAKLVRELEARKLRIPEGDKHTAAWRRAAMAAIETDEDMTGTGEGDLSAADDTDKGDTGP